MSGAPGAFEVFAGFDDVRYAIAVFFEEIIGGGDFAEAVGNAEAFDGCGVLLREYLAGRAAQSGDDVLGFDGDNSACLSGRSDEGISVERFYG